jgi:phosphopantothenoylcysteine decarboxylase/phosphopantothenate--cysteine ligase
MGYYIAEELASLNAEVYLVTGPTNLETNHPNIIRFNVETAQEMFDKSIELFEKCNAAILAAAVADYTPLYVSQQKIKKTDSEMVLKLRRTKDILAHLGGIKKDDQILVGFSLETDNEIENAKSKLIKKNLDFIILNSLRDEGAGFGVDTNKISIINDREEVLNFQLKSKKEVAVDIVNFLAGYFKD